MRCSVIIPARNEGKRISRTLEALRAQDYPNGYEIIVVVNASTDNTVEVARRFTDKVLSLEEGGAWRARNYGVENASGEVVLFIDADTLPPATWISMFMHEFDSDPDLKAVGGLLEPIEKGYFNERSFRIFNWRTRRSRYVMLFGGNSGFRKQFFLDIGGYNDVSYLEDIELSVRVRDVHRGKAKLCPNIMVKTSIRNHKGKRRKMRWVYHTNKEYKRLKGLYKSTPISNDIENLA